LSRVTGRGRARNASVSGGHELLHLEALHRGAAEPVAVRVEQPAVRAAEHVRRERLAQRVRLQQHREPRERALLGRRAGEAAERRPHRRLLVGTDVHALLQQPALDPSGGPGAPVLAVDARERLERDRIVRAEVVVLAAQAQDRGAQRAAHVEREHARARVTPELHRQRREQHRLAHAGRPDHERMADVADVRHQAEGRGAIGACDHQRRAVEVGVALRSRPHRRERQQVREVERRDDRLAHVRIRVARHRRQPCLHGVERLGHRDEAAALDRALHAAALLVGQSRLGIAHHHGRGRVAEGDLVGAELLQRRVRVGRLVARIVVDQRRFLPGERLAQQREHVLALGEPLPAQAAELPFRLGLVHAKEARRPAVGEAQSVEIVEDPGPGRCREAAHRHHAQVLVAEHRREATEQRAVREQRVEMERHLRDRHRVAPRRDRAVQVGERLTVVEPCDVGHRAVEQVEDAIGFRDERGQPLAPVHPIGRRVLVDQPGRAGTRLPRRQVLQREVVAALEVAAGFLEGRAPFLVHQPGQRLGKVRMRVTCRRPTLGLDV
jgi:hypothetical protein